MSNTRYRRGKLHPEELTACRDATSELTPRQQQLLTLYYGEGKSMPEIGDALGIDKSTVSRTIQRGERRLRNYLRCVRSTT